MIVTSLLLGQVSLARECGFAEKENPSLGLARDRFCFIGSTKKAQFAFAFFFQVITAITLVLKQNVWEGFSIALSIVPTVLYNSIILEKYLRPYQDAALLQSSRMYYQHGRDSNPSINTSSWLEQEEYRRWLVDCHKASYLPTCLSGGETNILTTEPAIVIAEGEDSAINTMDPRDDSEIWNRNDDKEDLRLRMKRLKRQKAQKGGILRRQRFNI
jgi:hypothetical protein